jgi:serine O-acetyltransferase
MGRTLVRVPDGIGSLAPVPEPADRKAFWRALHARHPGLRHALVEDARITAHFRGERSDFRSPLDAVTQMLRLALVSDAFAAQALYRAKAALQRRGVPVLPRLAHRLAMSLAQVSIGDPVVMAPGVYLVHGQVVLDGLVEIGAGVVIAPWVTIGLRAGDVQGPTIEGGANIGTGAKVIGPVRIGAGATVGANAVVVDDVPAGATVVGAPARVVGGTVQP